MSDPGIVYLTHPRFEPLQVPNPTEMQVKMWRESGYDFATKREYEQSRERRDPDPKPAA